MTSLAQRLYALTDKSPVRALSLILALALALSVFWLPSRFAAKTSPLEVWHAFVLIWAVCAGIIHGVGFRPRHLRWRIIFMPLPALIILLTALIYTFS